MARIYIEDGEACLVLEMQQQQSPPERPALAQVTAAQGLACHPAVAPEHLLAGAKIFRTTVPCW